MMCAWKELISILPPRIRADVDRQGKQTLQELRLRMGAPPELVLHGGVCRAGDAVTEDDLNFVINTASRYSPWAATSAAMGYITAPGGHRIGICGELAGNVQTAGFRRISSVCIRVARDFTGIGHIPGYSGESLLILGAPGWGKTTLLRDIARRVSEESCVSVVDEREELYPDGFLRGKRMDVLTGCPKPRGIDMALRTMGPTYLAVDEITSQEDCAAVVSAANCGVRLLATAHGVSRKDLSQRAVYRPLLENRVFDTLLILRSDKSWRTERMEL